MINFLLGVIVGILGLWFAAINTIRFTIYKEKITAYSEISEIASKIFNIISRVDIPETERGIKFRELYFELSMIVHKYTFIISSEVYNRVTNFCCNHTFESVNRNNKMFILDHAILTDTMRDDLYISKIDKLNDFLFSFKKALKNIYKNKKQ